MNERIKTEASYLHTEYSEDEPVRKTCLRCKRIALISGTILCVAFGTAILHTFLFVASSVRRCEICPAPALLSPCDFCPNGWIAFQRKCYYFSESEENWISSSLHCASHNGSLAVIDSQEEMNFLLRYKSPPDHWIGLRRDNPDKPWRWINDNDFLQWFTIYGGGRCAYMNHEAIASSSCTREEHWICNKMASYHCLSPSSE